MSEHSPESGTASVSEAESSTDQPTATDRPAADPTRIVADADVLAADLLAGGTAREALDAVRAHSWLAFVASDALLDDAAAVIRRLARETDDDLATDWRERVARERVPVDHPEGDHPGLASAYRGNAAHLLTFDEDLGSAEANLSLQPHVQVSIRSPDAFVGLFDAAALYETREDREEDEPDDYPGPDRDPRA